MFKRITLRLRSGHFIHTQGVDNEAKSILEVKKLVEFKARRGNIALATLTKLQRRNQQFFDFPKGGRNKAIFFVNRRSQCT
jgi:hypothetical protein